MSTIRKILNFFTRKDLKAEIQLERQHRDTAAYKRKLVVQDHFETHKTLMGLAKSKSQGNLRIVQ